MHRVAMATPIRLTRGVWRADDQLDTFAAHAAALLSACPPGTVISGLSAARLHQLWLPALPGNEPLEVILHPEIASQPVRSGCRRPEIRGRRRTLDACDLDTVAGLPVTSPARTWFELAGVLSLADVVAAGDCLLRFHCTRVEPAAVIARMRHHPGVVRARKGLELLDGRSRSRPESHLRLALVGGGLPTPAVNEPICTEFGEWLAEPDLSYDDVRLAIEYNGSDHAELHRMRRDITRQVDILGHGWLSVTAGPVEVFRRPDQFAALVAGLRRDRMRRLR
jgi:hypothetical protein